MSKLYVNNFSTETINAFADYASLRFISAMEQKRITSNVRSIKKDIEKAIENGLDVSADEKKLAKLASESKAVNAWFNQAVYGKHTKTTRVDGIVDLFGLDVVFEAAQKAAATGNYSQYERAIKSVIVDALDGNIPEKLVNSFCKGLIASLEVVKPSGRKAVKGILAEDTSYKRFATGFMDVMCQKFVDANLVKMYNETAFVVVVEYIDGRVLQARIIDKTEQEAEETEQKEEKTEQTEAEEQKEEQPVSAIFKTIVKILHPDNGNEMSEADKADFTEAVKARKAGDIAGLKAILRRVIARHPQAVAA